jgi:hypothetical protein
MARTRRFGILVATLLATIFINQVAGAYCPPGGVNSRYILCTCAGSQMYLYVTSCQGSGSGCDPLGGGQVYCTTNCAQWNAGSCTASRAPVTPDLTARLDDDLSMHGSSRLECPSAQVFNRWLSKKLSGHLDR